MLGLTIPATVGLVLVGHRVYNIWQKIQRAWNGDPDPARTCCHSARRKQLAYQHPSTGREHGRGCRKHGRIRSRYLGPSVDPGSLRAQCAKHVLVYRPTLAAVFAAASRQHVAAQCASGAPPSAPWARVSRCQVAAGSLQVLAYNTVVPGGEHHLCQFRGWQRRILPYFPNAGKSA